MYYGASLLMPLMVAAIIAIILDKPTKKMIKWGVSKWLSITLSILFMLVVLSLLSWLISSQLGAMAEDWSTIKEKSGEKLDGLFQWVNQNLNFDMKNHMENNKELVEKLQGFVAFFLSSITDMLSQSLIIFIYIILLMIQKNMFINFFKKLVSNPTAMEKILKKSSKVISSYLIGKGKIIIFLFGIYYVGFALGSVPYALFLALFASLFSIVPYVGNIIGGGVAVLLSFLYSGSTPALIVIGVISVAQLLENYILTPLIIGDEINLNPFITVFGVILFSTLWGMVGAVISLPIIGVLKVIFECTKGMEPYAYFLDNDD